MSNIKVKNLTDKNKRIRLTALDSAMVDISNSQGAVALSGKDMLLCLAPEAPFEDIILINDLSRTGELHWAATEVKEPTVEDWEAYKLGNDFFKRSGNTWQLQIDRTKPAPFSVATVEYGAQLVEINKYLPVSLALSHSLMSRLDDSEDTGKILEIEIYYPPLVGSSDPVKMPVGVEELRSMSTGKVVGDYHTIPFLNQYLSLLSFDYWMKLSAFDVDGNKIGTMRVEKADKSAAASYPKISDFKLPLGETFSFQLDREPVDPLSPNPDAMHNVSATYYEGDIANDPVIHTETLGSLSHRGETIGVGEYRGRGHTYTVGLQDKGITVQHHRDDVTGYLSGTVNLQLSIYYPNQKLDVVWTSHQVEYDTIHFTNGTLVIFSFAATNS